MTKNVASALKDSKQALTTVSDSPLLDSQILLCHVKGKPRQWLYAHSEEPLNEDEALVLDRLVERRRSGEPIAYITGSRSFWKREFEVTPATLVPRPETELIVETLLERFNQQTRTVLDLGTGSGAIAISLADERPNWHITATDISGEALCVAQRNAPELTNITFLQSDWFANVAGQFDIIVSNPPYIAAADPHLATLHYEPKSALASGVDGLDAIRIIARDSARHISPTGALIVEHGYDQQEKVLRIMQDNGWLETQGLLDLAQQPRAVIAGARAL